MNDLVISPVRKPAPIFPQSIQEAAQLAEVIYKSGTAPRGMNPASIMVAIMRGSAIGIEPFQAIDKIPIVNGRPLIMGEAALALVRGSGKAAYVKEWLEGEGDKRIAYCEAKRGEEIITRQFAVADARKAGLWGKSGPWTQYPDRMLGMRARAFCLRDGFPDVLGGLYLKEEFDGVTMDIAPEPSEPITAEQIIELTALIEETKTNDADFLKYMKVEALMDLDDKGYERAKTALLKKKAQNNV
jgi:hypothetical protein